MDIFCSLVSVVYVFPYFECCGIKNNEFYVQSRYFSAYSNSISEFFSIIRLQYAGLIARTNVNELNKMYAATHAQLYSIVLLTCVISFHLFELEDQ
jgi:hypothetical protein